MSLKDKGSAKRKQAFQNIHEKTNEKLRLLWHEIILKSGTAFYNMQLSQIFKDHHTHGFQTICSKIKLIPLSMELIFNSRGNEIKKEER